MVNQFRKLLDEHAVLPLWPETGQMLDLSRAGTYAAARSGEIKTVRFGRLRKVPTAWLGRSSGWMTAAVLSRELF